VHLKTYADLIKTANLLKIVQPGWHQMPFYFWNPAFKVHPHSYLTIAASVTLNQPMGKIQAGRPKGEALTANLPLKEAVESLKLNLAQFIRPIEHLPELIPQMEVRPRRYLLVYLPFQDTALGLVQP
jgi:hypothetical protein